MKKISSLYLALTAAAITFSTVISGCSSTTCGSGTVESAGKCLPASLTKCGTGTSLVSGECKSVCAEGTKEGTNGCVLKEESVCGPGTKAENNVCIVLDPLKLITTPEKAEPNNTVENGTPFVLPAMGAPAVVLGGIISAPTDSKVDEDAFTFEANAFDVIRVEATPVGAPALAVFVSQASDTDPNTYPLARVVFSQDARITAREIVIPSKGKWVVRVAERSNALFSTSAAGSESFTYTVKVSHLPSKQAQAFSGSATGTYETTGLYTYSPSVVTPSIVSFKPAADQKQFDGRRSIFATKADGSVIFASADTTTSTGSITRFAEKQVIIFPAETVTLGVDYILGTPKADALYTLEIKPVSDPVGVLGLVNAGDLKEETFSFENNVDGIKVFTVQAPENSILSVSIANEGDDIDGSYELRSSDMTLLGSTTGYSTLKAYVAAGSNTTYYIICKDTDLTDNAGSTDLQATVKIAVAGITDVIVNSSTPVVTALDTTSDKYYKVKYELTTNSKIDHLLEKTGTTSGYLYIDEITITGSKITTGSTLMSIYSTKDDATEFLATSKETLYFVGKTTTPQAANWTITMNPFVSIAEVEPNDTTPQTITLDAANNAIVLANLSSDLDVDQFLFDIAVDGEISIVVTGSTDVDTVTELYNSANSLVDEDDGLSSDKITKVIPAGQYRLKETLYISDFSDATPGSYTISISFKPTVTP